jgi:hypothetical protein
LSPSANGANALAAGPPDRGIDEPMRIVSSMGSFALSGSTQSSVETVQASPVGVAPSSAVVPSPAVVSSGGAVSPVSVASGAVDAAAPASVASVASVAASSSSPYAARTRDRAAPPP